ncbi:hypothetical protein GCM10027275_50120 [Rhabdobacter roseus]|uniref:Uncharacterized protein n=1 Tax=Rhabdobacter roseus TaxID=1655419 RepID=A0A840TV10_9BACT|nr:hypothetical protein [Rhabdobacter roseus]
MNSTETYQRGNDYEFFIRRAFKCERGKHGAETQTFKILLDAEYGSSDTPKDYDKRLEKVKGYLAKAVAKFLSRKPTQAEKEGLERMAPRIQRAGSAAELSKFLEFGLDLTIRYRDL